MDSFTIELVSNASFNCYPNNSLSSSTNFLAEQIHLKGEWEVANSEISYPSLYQNVTEGKFSFVDGLESSEEKKNIAPEQWYASIHRRSKFLGKRDNFFTQWEAHHWFVYLRKIVATKYQSSN